ncbi:MAG: polysaccharide deacetylase family protein [Gordonia sp. (in: high G+C Gram-positive bacteria)]
MTTGVLRGLFGRRPTRPGVLMYHCVREAHCDPWGICVSPQAFDEQMAVLAQTRRVADLGVFAGGVPIDGPTAGGPMAVTFDDGYADNVTAALPILERHDVPATVFVIGTAVGRAREFWWDVLERAVLDAPQLPPELDFPFGNGPPRYVVDDRPGDRDANAGWRADDHAPRTPRQRLFRDLWDAIVVLEPPAQDDAVDCLLDWSGVPHQPADPRRAVTPEEFAELAAHPLITIGAHTLDHVSLTDLSPLRQYEQIRDGRDAIAELTGGAVERFSFPYGRNNVSSRCAVRDLGFRIGCTSAPDSVFPGDDPLALPRPQALDMDGDAFDRWLRVALRC